MIDGLRINQIIGGRQSVTKVNMSAGGVAFYNVTTVTIRLPARHGSGSMPL